MGSGSPGSISTKTAVQLGIWQWSYTDKAFFATVL